MGFAKLNRDIVDSEIYYNDKLLAFYVRLILLSRIKPCCDHGILVGTGQILTSVRKLADVLNMPASNTHRQLNTLQEKHLISIEKCSSGSLITVLNYNCEKNFSEKQEQQNECSAKHFGNTFGTPTLLNKKEKQVKQGVPCARGQKAIIENSKIKNSELGENSENNLQDQINRENGDPEEKENRNCSEIHFPTRESLVEKYGEKNVFDYECRFVRWKTRQNKPVRITCYEAIERWMRDDNVQKPYSEGAFNTDEIMQRIMENYSR